MTTAAKTAPRLALIELLDADGHVTQAFDVAAWPVKIGRALDNDLVLHDPHVAPHHATLELDADARLVLAVGTSRNGARIEVKGLDQRLASGERAALPPLARWRLGTSTLRARRTEDPLATELPVSAINMPWSRWKVAALGLALILWFAASLWMEHQPDDGWGAYAPPLLALPFALTVWSGLWGLASKLFTRRFVFLPHLHAACAYLLAMVATELLLALVAYAFDWPLASALTSTVTALIGAGLIAHHLRIVAPSYIRLTHVAVATAIFIALAISMALRWERNDQVLDQLYLTALPPPQLRLVDGQAPAALVEELRPLQNQLAERARKLAQKDIEP